jgi:PKHD-type hydroxylase
MSRTYLAMADAFKPAQCDALVVLGAAAPDAAGPVWTAAAYGIDPDARDVRSTLHERDGDTGWLFDRLDALFAQAAEALGFFVGPIVEPVQILRYGEGCHFGRWHSDSGLDRQESRKISVSVELSDAGDYQGGLLEIVPDTVARPRTLPRGGAHFFPSRALHRVGPVTGGVRWSLVAWTG